MSRPRLRPRRESWRLRSSSDWHGEASETGANIGRNRKFESISLQRRVPYLQWTAGVRAKSLALSQRSVQGWGRQIVRGPVPPRSYSPDGISYLWFKNLLTAPLRLDRVPA